METGNSYFYVEFSSDIVFKGDLLQSPKISKSAGYKVVSYHQVTGYAYRKEITITNPGSALTDYVVPITVSKGSGTDADSIVYLGDGSQAWSDSIHDLRFTDVSGTQLSYWVEKGTVTTTAGKVYVKVSSIAASPTTTTVYMYYGKHGDATTGSGTNTFQFFDDFEGSSLGSAWATRWGGGTYTVANSMCYSVNNGTAALEIRSVNITNPVAPVRVLMRMKSTHIGDTTGYTPAFGYAGPSTSDGAAMIYQSSSDTSVTFRSNDGSQNQETVITPGTITPRQWFKTEFKCKTTSDECIIDGSSIATHTLKVAPLTNSYLRWQTQTIGTALPDSDMFVDWMAYCYLANSEPTLAFGTATALTTNVPASYAVTAAQVTTQTLPAVSLTYAVSTSITDSFESSNAMTFDQPNRVAFRYDDATGEAAIFVNGVKTSITYSLPDMADFTSIYVGTAYDGVSEHGNFHIRDLVISNVSRTDDDLTARNTTDDLPIDGHTVSVTSLESDLSQRRRFLTYHVAAPKTAFTEDLTYAVKATKSAFTSDLTYKVAAPKTPFSTALKYTVPCSRLAAISDLAYAVQVAKSTIPAKDLAYTVKATKTNPAAKDLVYRVSVTKTNPTAKDLTYVVQATKTNPAAKDLVYRVSVTKTNPTAKDLTYVVRYTTTKSVPAKDIVYRVSKATSMSAKDLKYCVPSTKTAAILDLTYVVIATKSVPDKDLVYAVSVTKSAPATKDLKYVVQSSHPTTKSLKYCVPSTKSAPATKDLKYVVQSSHPTIKSLKYTVPSTKTAPTKDIMYRVGRTTSATTKDLKYTVPSTKTAFTETLKYCVPATKTAFTSGLKYAVKSSHPTTKSLKYTVPSTKTAFTKTIVYRASHAPTASTKDLKYVVYSTHSAFTKSLTYAVKVTKSAPATKDLKYVVKSSHPTTKSLKYTVPSTKSAFTKGLAYVVGLPPKGFTQNLKYCVPSTKSAFTESLKYCIPTTNAGFAKSLAYSVAVPKTSTKSLKYCVPVTRSATVYDLRYAAQYTPDAIQKNSEYKVLAAKDAITKTSDYEVLSTHLAAPRAAFARNSVAYGSDGSQVPANAPRFEPSTGGNRLTSYYNFEDGLTYWGITSANGTIERSTEWAWDGTYSGKCINSDGAAMSIGRWNIGVNAGEKINVSIRVKAPTACNISLSLQNQNSPWTIWGTTGSVSLTAGQEKTLSTSGTVDVNTIAIVGITVSGLAATQYVYVDNLIVQRIPGLTIEEGTQNLLPSNYWMYPYGMSESNVTDSPLGGITAKKYVTNGTGAQVGAYGGSSWPGTAAALPYTLSMYIKGDAGKVVRVVSDERDAVNAPVGYHYVDVTLTSAWQRIVISATTAATCVNIVPNVAVYSPNNDTPLTFYVAGWQLENKSYATSYIPINSTRNAETLTIPTAGILSTSEGTVEMLINVPENYAGTQRYYFMADYNYRNRIMLEHESAPSRFKITLSNNDSSQLVTQSVIPDTYTSAGVHRLSFKWNANELSIWWDGTKYDAQPTPYLPVLLDTIAFIGSNTSGTFQADAQISDLVISSIARTDVEMTARGVSTPLGADANTTYYLPLTADTKVSPQVYAMKYAVLIAPAETAKDLKYVVQSSHVSTKALKYTVPTTKTGSAKDIKYAVYSTSVSTKGLKYTVPTTKAAFTKALEYAVKSTCSTPAKNLTYRVGRTISATDKPLRYAVLKARPTTKDLKYVVQSNHVSTKSLKYTVPATKQATTKDLKYVVYSTHVSTKALKYCVPTTKQAFTKALEYAVASSHPTTKALKYTVPRTVTAFTKSLKYTLPGQGTVINKDLKYCVPSTKTVPAKSLKYNVLTTPTAATKDLKYAVVKSHPTTKPLKYVVFSTHPTTKGLKYCIPTTHASTKGLKYTVPTTKVTTKGLKYCIPITKSAFTKTLKYVVFSTHASTKALKYTVPTTKVTAKDLQYVVKSSHASTKALKYCIPTTKAAFTKSLKYAVVKAKSVGTRDLKYTVPTTKTFTKSLRYSIPGQGTAFSKDLKYCIPTTPAPATKPLVYRVSLTKAAFTKNLRYAVMVARPTTKGLKYAVFSTHASTKGLKYTVPTTKTFTKGLEYAVFIGYYRYTFTKGLTYNVLKPRSVAAKGVRYVVKATNTAQTKALKYCVPTTKTAFTKNLKYAVVKAKSAGTKALKYTVPSTKTAFTKALKYNVKATKLALTKDAKYAVKSAHVTATGLKYVVFSTHASAKTLKYTVPSTKTDTKGLRYVVGMPPKGLTKALKYCVPSIKTFTKGIRYTVKSAASAKTKGLRYCVPITKTAPAAKALKYTVPTTKTAFTKALKYTVPTTKTAFTKALKYTVPTTKTAFTKALKYTVPTTKTAFTKAIQYDVKVTKPVPSKALQYTVQTFHVDTKALKYCVPSTKLMPSKDLKYVVRASYTKAGTINLTYVVCQPVVTDTLVLDSAIETKVVLRSYISGTNSIQLGSEIEGTSMRLDSGIVNILILQSSVTDTIRLRS